MQQLWSLKTSLYIAALLIPIFIGFSSGHTRVGVCREVGLGERQASGQHTLGMQRLDAADSADKNLNVNL